MKLLSFLACVSLWISPLAFAGPDDEAYFKQFHYREVNSSPDPDFPTLTYWVLQADVHFNVALNDKQDIFLMVDAKINDDGTFVMQYNDGVGDKGASSWMPRNCKIISGKWAVPDKSLLLYGDDGTLLMTGVRAYGDGQNQVKIKFEKGFPVADVRGAESDYMMAQSSQPVSMQCFPDFPTPMP